MFLHGYNSTTPMTWRRNLFSYGLFTLKKVNLSGS